MQTIKKKFGSDNAHVVLSSLQVRAQNSMTRRTIDPFSQCLESIVKNCGGSIHKELAQRDMIDALRELAKVLVDSTERRTVITRSTELVVQANRARSSRTRTI
jgi:hypothetical protein